MQKGKDVRKGRWKSGMKIESKERKDEKRDEDRARREGRKCKMEQITA